jgi:hypothetical protein
MVKLIISGKIYTAEKEIAIRNEGHLFVDNVDQGVIGYQCCIKTIEGTLDQSKSKKGILRWH